MSTAAVLLLLLGAFDGSATAQDGVGNGGLPPGIELKAPGHARRPLQFGTSLAEARRESEKTGRPLLLLVVRDEPPSPPCVALHEAVFASRESGKLDERIVPVRLVGGRGAGPETWECMRRFEVTGYPTLLLLSHDLHLIERLDVDSLPALNTALDAAKEREAAFRELVADQSGVPGADAIVVGALEERMAWDDLLPRYVSDLQDEETLPAYANLIRVYAHLGTRDVEQRLIERVLEAHPDAPERIEWHLRRLELAAPPRDSMRPHHHFESSLALLTGLIRDAAQRKDVDLEAAALAKRGHVMLRSDPVIGRGDGAESDFVRAIELRPAPEFVASSLWGLALCAFRDTRLEDCERRLLQLLDGYPDSPEAALAPAALDQVRARRPTPVPRPTLDDPEPEDADSGTE